MTTHLTPELTNFRNILKKSGFTNAEKLNYPYLFQDITHPTSQKNFEKIIEWYLKDFNLAFTKKLLEKGYDFLSLEGAELVTVLFKIVREEFKGPTQLNNKLSITQFKLENKFLKQKIIFLTFVGETFLKMRPKTTKKVPNRPRSGSKNSNVLGETDENGQLKITDLLDEINKLAKKTEEEGSLEPFGNRKGNAGPKVMLDSLDHISIGAADYKKISSENIQSFGKESSSMEIRRNKNPRLGTVVGPTSHARPPIGSIGKRARTPLKMDYLTEIRLEAISKSTPKKNVKKSNSHLAISNQTLNQTNIFPIGQSSHSMMNKAFKRIASIYSTKQFYTREDFLVLEKMIETFETFDKNPRIDLDFEMSKAEYTGFMDRMEKL